MSLFNKIIEKAKAADIKLVFPEGQDPRVIQAATKVVNEGVARVVVLGTEAEIKKSCHDACIETRNFEIIDPLNSDLLPEFAQEFYTMRKKKGLTEEAARLTMENRLYFANMMCKKGLVDGLVAGSVASTGDMLRASFQVIGTSPGIKTGSSSMLLELASPSPAGHTSLVFADCAVNPDPTAEQLVDIAISSAQTYYSLTNQTPKLGFLSFSTNGSADHESLNKIKLAASLTKVKVESEGLNIIVDGEMQADAAIVPSVAASKCPSSELKGEANVLIFPDLNAGNISYKLVQRLAGASAYGPILQGLAKPVNDLSRGCSVDDIYGVAAITACQSVS